MKALPPNLLDAISVPGGGKITLVIGAGCSIEAPTSIPLAATCSQECHDRLVANGVLTDGDCSEPSNLSSLADAVFVKTGSQQALVDQLLQHYKLKTASPNEGHFIAGALLREGAIASILSLNFDLALSAAIMHLGVGDKVGIIDGPNELGNQNSFNLFYLHRNANTASANDWILRTAALETEWKNRWEQVIVAKVLATPVVLFAGIGGSADVLIESSKLIRSAIPKKSDAYQINPGSPAKSKFSKALGIHSGYFVKAKWCEFMSALSQRLVIEQVSHLKNSADRIVEENSLVPEDLTSLLKRLREIGLLKLGALRANWLLQPKRYFAEELLATGLIADLLLATALIGRVTGTEAILFEDGRVEFQRGARVVSTYLFVSGQGVRNRSAIEAELSRRRRSGQSSVSMLSGAVVSGTTSDAAHPITPPRDVVLGDTSSSIVYGQSAMPIVHIDTLRQDNAKCLMMAP